MREKLATLPLTQLKELAKSQGIRNISGLRKAELIVRLCEAAESAGGAKVPAENNENRENTAAPMQAAAQKEKAPAAGNVSGGAGQEKMASERPAVFQDRTGRPEKTERAERYERNDRQERGERQMRNDRQGSYQSRQNNYRDRQSNYQDRQSSYQDRQSGQQDRQISYQDRQSSYQDRQNAYQGQSSAQDSQTQGNYQTARLRAACRIPREFRRAQEPIRLVTRQETRVLRVIPRNRRQIFRISTAGSRQTEF